MWNLLVMPKAALAGWHWGLPRSAAPRDEVGSIRGFVGLQ